MSVTGAGSLKQALREEYKSKREAVTGSDRIFAEEKILRSIAGLDSFKSCDTLFTYISAGSEADTRRIIALAFHEGKSVAVPVCFGGGEMRFYYINSLAEVSPKRYGIPEPEPDEKKLALPDEKSLFVVPGVAFDCEGFRLGMGGGYYDRYLAGHQCLTAGICFECCVCDKLPNESFDKNVFYLITDERIITNGGKSAERGHTYE